MKRGLIIVLVWVLGLTLGQVGPGQAVFKDGIPLILPGDALGWKDSTLKLLLRVEEPGEVWIQMYSPGFDPKDYRSPHELGDERYDRGKGDLLAVYEFWQGRRLVVRKSFGEEPHRWATLFRGRLEPGEYRITARFFGNGKNAVIFNAKALSGKARLLIAPDSMFTYNVVRGGWQTPFVLGVPKKSPELKVGVYDGDGPKELAMEVETPNGKLKPEVPGNLEWTYIKTEDAGRYAFRFRIPQTAKQHTNTVGIRVFLAPIRVEIVDEQGRPVPGASYRIEGSYLRRVVLKKPEGWALVRTEQQGGEVKAPGLVEFGMGAGWVRFVLKRVRPMARLRVEAFASCGDWREPYPLVIHIGDRKVALPPSGSVLLELPSGTYELLPKSPAGARVEGDVRVLLQPGKETVARFEVRPQIELGIELNKSRLREGERLRVRVVARTDFEKAIPAEVYLDLPNGLEPEGPTRIRAPLRAGRPVRLEVPVFLRKAGDFELKSGVEPCGVLRKARLAVVAPAKFQLEKRALTPEVALGEEGAFELVVRNVGGEPGSVRLLDTPPEGFEAKPLDVELQLKPGQEVRRLVRGRVSAGPVLENTAMLRHGGVKLAEARASIRVLVPEARLTRELDKPKVLPGEEVRVCLRVENLSERSTLRYTLRDTPPEWIRVESAPVFEGALDPKAAKVHCYLGQVKFGPEVKGRFLARLESNAGSQEAEESIQRVLIALAKEVAPQRVMLGQPAKFAVRLQNPLDREATVRFVDTPVEGLGMKREERDLTLGPREVRTLTFEAKPERVGSLKNQAAVFLGSEPAAFPATAVLEVLPPLSAKRESTVELDFSVKGRGTALLLRHAPPEGAQYVSGSSRLDGVPIEDPKVDDQGRLYWKLPFVEKGKLTYKLAHKGALPTLAEPELALIYGERLVRLKGNITLQDYQKAHALPSGVREGLIKEPAPGTLFVERSSTRIVVEAPYGREIQVFVNGKPVPRKLMGEARYDRRVGTVMQIYYAVPLREGRNVIEVRVGERYDKVEVFRSGRPERVTLVPEHAVADGRTPLRFKLRFLDAYGLPSGMGFATVDARPEPKKPDALSSKSGYQIRIQRGEGELVLAPMATAGEVRVRVTFNEIEDELTYFVPGPAERYYLAQGSVTLRYHQGTLEVGGVGRAYVETPLAGGRFQGAIDQSFGKGQRYPGLGEPENPTGRFPVTGAGEEAKLPLVSEDGVAFRYDRGPFSLGYGREVLKPVSLVLPKASALAAEYRGPVRLGAFLALLSRDTKTIEIVPDGTRVYDLREAVKPGSEEVWLVREGVRERLVPLRDYVLDYPSGTLYLSRNLWPTDAELQPQRLVVSYVPENAPRDRLAYGASLEYRQSGFGVWAAVATLDAGATYRFGVGASYRWEGLALQAAYRYEQGRGTLELYASGRAGRLQTEANLRYQDRLTGRARVAVELGGGSRIALEHEGRAGQNESGVFLEQRFGRNLFAGVGAGYRWETASFAVLGRVGYKNEGFSLRATHSQPFNGDPESRLRMAYALDPNLTLKSELAYRWGKGIGGVIGLDQRLGTANLSIAYRLPGASGEGNRARFGLRAPLPINEHWALDLSAGYEQAFTTGERQLGAGVAARYQSDGFSATVGVEGATGTEGEKLSFRAGATGQLDRRQVVSFDATYRLVPERKGRFTLAYAYRGRVLQVLTYHRLESRDPGPELTGELASTWHPSLDFQLRPSFAYRINFGDPGATLYQAGLGFNYYPSTLLGFGAGGYYLYQPESDTQYLNFSIEGSLRLLDPLWLNLGYTYGTFEGLTPEARPGVYLRFDFFGGTDCKCEEVGR